MALPEQKEKLIRREELVVSKLITERFIDLLKQEKAFTLYSIDFDVESDSKSPDGTKYTTTKPVVVEETSNFGDVPSRYLLQQDGRGTFAYFIEFETIDHRDGSNHFVGITRVPSLKSYKDLGEWKNEVLSRRVRPARHRREKDFLPGIAIQLLGSNRLIVELLLEDINLKDLYETLTRQPIS